MGKRGDDRTAGKKAWRRCGGTFVCIASGPSLEHWQCDHLRDKAAVLIATNTSFRALPRTGIVYGCDEIWWQHHHREVREARHEGWTQDLDAAARYAINHVKGAQGKGLSRVEGVIHHGRNSGYQAIGLAYQLGAERILLLGYDMQRTGGRSHWHGDHPKPLRNVPGIDGFKHDFPALADDLKAEGVDVINCTTETALTCFPRADIREVI